MRKLKKKKIKSVKEADLGLTYKKGKTVKVKHKTSGKTLVIIDKPVVRKEYEKIGYFAEGLKEDNIKISKKEMGKLHRDGKLKKGGHEIEFNERKVSKVNEYTYGKGDIVRDINPTCPHYGAVGKVKSINPKSVVFVVMNKGKKYKPGDVLDKTHDQMIQMIPQND